MTSTTIDGTTKVSFTIKEWVAATVFIAIGLFGWWDTRGEVARLATNHAVSSAIAKTNSDTLIQIQASRFTRSDGEALRDRISKLEVQYDNVLDGLADIKDLLKEHRP